MTDSTEQNKKAPATRSASKRGGTRKAPAKVTAPETVAAETAAEKTAATKAVAAQVEAVEAVEAKAEEPKAAPAAKAPAKKTASRKPAAKKAPARKPAAKKAATKPVVAADAKNVKAAAEPVAAEAEAKAEAKAETKDAAVAVKPAAPVKKVAAKPAASKPAKPAVETPKPAEEPVKEVVAEPETPKAEEPAKKEPAKKEPAKKEPAVEAPKPAAEPEPETPKAEEPAEPAAEAPKAEPAAEAPKAEPAPEEEKPEPVAEQPSEEPAEQEPAPVEVPAPAREFADVPDVLIAAAECAPFVKVGGLADVVGALPKYLKPLGIEARVIMPLHRQIKEKYFNQMEHLCDFQASLGWRSQYVGVERLELDGNVYYFIDNEFYFGGPIYCGGEFEGEQYAFFTRAVMDAIPQLDFNPRILHCNDWHTAMMPLLAKTQYQGGMQSGLKTVLTIHNLKFQGQFSHEFDRDLLRVDDSLATPQFIEHYGCDNMLKAGIVFADKVNTVSPTYSQEICGPDMGESLDGVLRSRGGDLWGILNGLDNEAWDPRTDAELPFHFSEKSLNRKAKVKAALLEELGLAPAPEGEEVPVIGMVGRLTPQKGIDLVRCVLDDIMAENVRVIMLGSGDEEYEDFFRDAENRYKGRLCSYIGYNGPLSHRIYAGSDLFLMPSLFEPCGLSQIIAMRYGTLPIVRETGGLKDTVHPWNEFTGEGNGFSFANYNAHEMLGCIRYALGTWWNKDAREKLIKNAMATDYGFELCARTYALFYRTLGA